ncbi:Cell division protein FtsA [Paraliobacillus sp. PM-2]|uniref:pilus assembly protein PilM n=1 Tax=Paraliobacillus sp. PM-2 TaxID=1462524 RepID=UPI00061C10E4|nr:pilus assembly protein PilM [Paraliobacillus sp. PM-2]CQR48161.1 Cell division protein FtsA [Paraliobacillus sp. PM-2]
MSEQIFALDIGTRSVIGLLLHQTDTSYTITDYVVREHTERSMLDGQIHDVVSVSKVIKEVKEQLEQKHQIVLREVCVAAAGRALKTKRTTIKKNISLQPLISKEDILFMELSAVQQAQYDLAIEEREHSLTHYYCVGYSVLQYKLDQDIIGSLIDQQGEQAEVEIIATFLPKVVVESLIAALQRADLEMEALTLEPIAAINVLIPTSMRRLNVALVDIGAGTSDIALTDTGTITAYGMVPKAGDEITEAISDYYLLDFNEAERVKRDITAHNEAVLTDILGFKQTISIEELATAIKPAIDELASAIAEEVIALNAKSPKAVMLVGGGSLTPHLTTHLANRLQLPDNRVAIRATDAISSLNFDVEMPKGPAFITPIGIAIAAKQNPIHYISITVNHRVVRLFDVKQLTIGDCLLAAGIHIDKLYGLPGMAYMIRFNNQRITLPGSYGRPPKITLNNELVTVNESIKHGDVLNVEKGENGKEPDVTIEEIVGELEQFRIYYNNQPHLLQAELVVNDKKANKNYKIQDNDDIELKEINTVHDFLHSINQIENLINNKSFILEVDGKKKNFPPFMKQILINKHPATPDTILKPEDRLEFVERKEPTVYHLLEELNESIYQTLKITFNGEQVTLQKQVKNVLRNGKKVDIHAILTRDDKIELKLIEQQHFIFQDIFKFVSIDLTEIKPGVEIKRNGQPATFLDPIEENDEITIK